MNFTCLGSQWKLILLFISCDPIAVKMLASSWHHLVCLVLWHTKMVLIKFCILIYKRRMLKPKDTFCYQWAILEISTVDCWRQSFSLNFSTFSNSINWQSRVYIAAMLSWTPDTRHRMERSKRWKSDKIRKM